MNKHVYSKYHDPLITYEDQYEMPVIPSIKNITLKYLIPYSNKNKEFNGTVHFWIDDYKFNSVIESPNRYMKVMKKYDHVIQPDNSSYGDWNYNVQRFQQFQRQWIAAYWTARGNITIIPNIHLPPNQDAKWDFFWAGVPKKSIISISGQQVSDRCKNEREQQWFLSGFKEMLERLEPLHVYYYGGRIKKLDEKYGNIVTRFSRHSFVGQHATPKKYTYTTGKEIWEECQPQEQWDEQKQSEEVSLNIQHKLKEQLMKHSNPLKNVMKQPSQQWKNDTKKQCLSHEQTQLENGQQCNSSINLESQVNKSLLQKNKQLEIGSSYKQKLDLEWKKENTLLSEYLLQELPMPLEKHLQSLMLNLEKEDRSSYEFQNIQSNKKFEKFENNLYMNELIQPHPGLYKDQQNFLNIKSQQKNNIKIFQKKRKNGCKQPKPIILSKQFKIRKTNKKIYNSNYLLYHLVGLFQESINKIKPYSKEYQKGQRKELGKNTEKSFLKQQYQFSASNTQPELEQNLSKVKPNWNPVYNMMNMIYQLDYQNLQRLRSQHILKLEQENNIVKLFIKKHQSNKLHLIFMIKLINEKYTNQYHHQKYNDFRSQQNNLKCITPQNFQKLENDIISQEKNLKRHRKIANTLVNIIYQDLMKNLFLDITKLPSTHLGKNKYNKKIKKLKKQLISLNSINENKLIKKYKNITNYNENWKKQQQKHEILISSLSLSTHWPPKKEKEHKNMENQSLPQNNLKYQLDNGQKQQDQLREYIKKLPDNVESNLEKNLPKKQVGMTNKSIVLKRNLADTNVALIYSGFPIQHRMYQYLIEHNYNITLINIATEWNFPEVSTFLSSIPNIITIPTNRRLNSLLFKRGWPSMRGGNKAWHMKEFEETVDKYLTENNLIEIIPFTSETKESHIKAREKRKTQFIAPLLDNDIELSHYNIPTFTELSELQDNCESHYLSPIKGLMYTSLRSKGELEYLFNAHQEYNEYYNNNRAMRSIEKVWADIIQLDDQIKKKPSYFHNYNTLLDLVYEFDGKRLETMIPEYKEQYIKTGQIITKEEYRRGRIEEAIKNGKWMWAKNDRDKVTWYPIRPLQFSKSGKTVRVITLDGFKHERDLPFTNLYTLPSKDYYGKIEL